MSEIERANAWIVGSDSGLSSKAIWAHMMGTMPSRDGWSHPHDPADFGRCARLLNLMPEWRSRLAEMADRSPAWRALVASWSEIEASMSEEVGIDWSKGHNAPLTYDLMKRVLAGAGTIPADCTRGRS